MRPLNLRISAFGPYAGETVIPMQKLGTKGLYLITGDTGAGKTTIFDAICYALFGKPSGDSRDASMLRSKYADPGTPTEVELLFSHNGKEYRIVRNPEYERPAKRGDGFTKEAANACLYMPDGKTVTKLKEVTDAVVNLLGINREQFSQISMIAQGDFKKLLLADTMQRQEIFRKLFKTAYYGELQKALAKKSKDISDMADDGKKSIAQYIGDICVNEDDALALEVEKAKKGELTTDVIIELIEKIIAQDEAEKEKRDTELSERNRELKQINERIGAAEAVNKARENLEISKKQLEIELPREKELQESYDKAKSGLARKDELNREKAKIEEEISKLARIEKLQAVINDNETVIAKLEAALRNAEAEKSGEENRLAELKNEHASIKDVTVSIEKLNNELRETRETQNSLKELVSDYDEYKKESESLKAALKKYEDDNAEFRKANDLYESMEQAFRDGQAGILAASLVEGQKCPVCGSLCHPEKACFSSAIPSEKELDEAKSVAEAARKKANKSSETAGEKKASLERWLEALKKESRKLLATDDIETLAERIQSRQDEVTSCVKEISEKLSYEESKAKRREQLEKLIPEIEGEIRNLETKISSAKEQLAGKRTSVSENRKQIEDMKTNISFSDKVEAENKKRELEESIKELQEQYDAAAQKWQEVREEIAALEGEIESCQKNLEGKEILDIEAEKLKRNECERKQSDTIKLLKSIDSGLDRNKSVLSSIKKQSEEIVEIEKQLQWVSALSDTANGKLRGKEKIMLETYIQMTYFDRIISRANLRFMKMSGGQYELKRQNEASDSKSQSGLELGIVDHYNGSERSVKTLSGGESFMASLSLALGLSDEVQSSAGGIQVDTMFVDEGFGSLDSDSLDQAYKALAGLTEGNRLVGIISHVAELKSKIDNQVIVKKEKSGGSFVYVQS